MASSLFTTFFFFLLSPSIFFLPACSSSPLHSRSLFLVSSDPVVLQYHNGSLLAGNLAVNLLWYGRFSPTQRHIVSDFILSLSFSSAAAAAVPAPNAFSWWNTTSSYAGAAARLTLGRQILDDGLSLGPSLSSTDVELLAAKVFPHRQSIVVVLTAANVTVDGFCVSRCGHHGSASARLAGARRKARLVYVWVGDSSEQCPGECAWPFHRPTYGPREAPPLLPPNSDLGIDGAVINLAAMLASVVTNPYGDGYFQGPPEAPLEATTACTGVFGPGAYPGYPGQLPVDSTSGASYNAMGLGGRKYLLPAMWDPRSSQCSTLARSSVH